MPRDGQTQPHAHPWAFHVESQLEDSVGEVLGEGMLARKLGEWYEAQGFAAPYALGIATVLLTRGATV